MSEALSFPGLGVYRGSVSWILPSLLRAILLVISHNAEFHSAEIAISCDPLTLFMYG